MPKYDYEYYSGAESDQFVSGKYFTSVFFPLVLIYC